MCVIVTPSPVNVFVTTLKLAKFLHGLHTFTLIVVSVLLSLSRVRNIAGARVTLIKPETCTKRPALVHALRLRDPIPRFARTSLRNAESAITTRRTRDEMLRTGRDDACLRARIARLVRRLRRTTVTVYRKRYVYVRAWACVSCKWSLTTIRLRCSSVLSARRCSEEHCSW